MKKGDLIYCINERKGTILNIDKIKNKLTIQWWDNTISDYVLDLYMQNKTFFNYEKWK